MKPAVFLDRDGTLIIDKVYLNDPDAIEYLPGVFEGLRLLQTAGFELVVVTNQSGVARGIVTLENLAEIHRRIERRCAEESVTLNKFYFAPFPADRPHPMRKPEPGMLLAGARDHGIDLSRSWMVGDRGTDIEAGVKAGARTVFITGTEAPPQNPRPNIIADDFLTLARRILTESLTNGTSADLN